MTVLGRLTARLQAAWLDALAILVPTSCAGCGAPDRSLCSRCRRELIADPVRVDIGEARNFPVWCALRYAGPVRRMILAMKDGGRTTIARQLAAPLRIALLVALEHCGDDRGDIEIVTIPSTRRALRGRGYSPIGLLLAGARLRAPPLLRMARQTEDQAGLGQAERKQNRTGSLVAACRLDGRRFLIVDDILTTGATLLEARRALEDAGGHVLFAVVLANTERRNRG